MKIFLSTVIILIVAAMMGGSAVVSAAGDCAPPYYIPQACPSPYVPGQRGGYTADLNCPLSGFINPEAPGCCRNKCVDSSGNSLSGTTTNPENPVEFQRFEVFGTTIRLNPDNIPSLINILFTTALGFVSLYTIARGIYVAGVKRASAQSAEDIANVTKELTNLLIGALIAWGFIIVIQVIAGLLGVGQLNNLDISGGDNLVVTIN
jgi:hypothetical protein